MEKLQEYGIQYILLFVVNIDYYEASWKEIEGIRKTATDQRSDYVIVNYTSKLFEENLLVKKSVGRLHYSRKRPIRQ